ncbi:hypothetical protein AVEN_149702-1 [Araneus ventricosus]|uniref:Uncharacterized protein n=1 Tax=Araneus ventricosus TaxID=182803 RepID=A0A4Y2G9V2_ARAVE|nr:hypothetical protein AVEN_149702-1 [Araneus ventricosus]
MHEPLCKDRCFYLAARGSFCLDGYVIFCNDVDSLFTTLGLQNAQEWRLLIDSSKVSLKAVLLHNGNKDPSIPVGYAVRIKETYETLKHMLSNIVQHAFLAYLRRLESDCRLSWIASRLHQILLLFVPVGQQAPKKALHQECVAQATVPHTGCEE